MTGVKAVTATFDELESVPAHVDRPESREGKSRGQCDNSGPLSAPWHVGLRRSRHAGAWVTALVIVGVAAAASSAYAAASTSRPIDGSPETPLVTLGSGEIGADSWSASLRREQGSEGEGPRGEERPCIEARSLGYGGGSASTACVFSQRLTPLEGGLWVTTSVLNEARTDPVMTAVAMVFAPLAASVEVTRPDGTVETIKLKRLTAGQAGKAGLKRLRYTAFATAGLWCVARIESFDRADQRLWRSSNLRRKTCSVES